MQIQLKQTEIITALKQYITSQGIDLAGKEVSVAFTAGRKESGISAEMDIEDNPLPDFADAEEEAPAPINKAPVLSMVAASPATESPESGPSDEPPKTTSLFA
jgi:hypothetical protein